jgi:hypothetical protein
MVQLKGRHFLTSRAIITLPTRTQLTSNQKAETTLDPFSHTCVRNAWLGCDMGNCKECCAYANGFPVLVEGLDVVTIRTSAGSDDMSF